MNPAELSDRITEVSVSASKKVQLQQYEPITEHAELTAEVREGDDPSEVLDGLEDQAWEQVEEGVMERYETHVRKDEDSE
jgi:hypothetical protein